MVASLNIVLYNVFGAGGPELYGELLGFIEAMKIE